MPKKDKWEKLKVIAGFLTPLSIGLVGLLLNSYLKTRDLAMLEHQFQIQVQSQRMESESLMRRDMLRIVKETFYPVEEQRPFSIDEQLQIMELFAVNIHDSFSITPIFRRLYNDIIVLSEGEPDFGEAYMTRLQQLLNKVKEKQIAGLDDSRIAYRKRVFETGKKPEPKTFPLIQTKKNTYKLMITPIEWLHTEAQFIVELYQDEDIKADIPGMTVSLFDLPIAGTTLLVPDLAIVILVDEYIDRMVIYSVILIPSI